jgi:hypothetical protein
MHTLDKGSRGSGLRGERDAEQGGEAEDQAEAVATALDRGEAEEADPRQLPERAPGVARPNLAGALETSRGQKGSKAPVLLS